MSWHRIIKIPAGKNFFFHYTVESYDNIGIVSTLSKERENLVLECSTPLSSAVFFDQLIDKILKEIKNEFPPN
ncbi:MAG: hypothetical protein ACOX2F_09425 [bacterium]